MTRVLHKKFAENHEERRNRCQSVSLQSLVPSTRPTSRCGKKLKQSNSLTPSFVLPFFLLTHKFASFQSTSLVQLINAKMETKVSYNFRACHWLTPKIRLRIRKGNRISLSLCRTSFL